MRPRLVEITLLFLFTLPVMGDEKLPHIYSRFQDIELKGDHSNGPHCPSPVASVIKNNKKLTLLLGQTSFTIDKGKKYFSSKQKGNKDYTCDEKIIVKASNEKVEKSTLVSNCSGEDKKLARKLVESISLEEDHIVYRKNDTLIKDQIKCAYSIK